MARGKLITIEGLDGAGKTTLALSARRRTAHAGHRRPAAPRAGWRPRRRADPRAGQGPRTRTSPLAPRRLLYAAARAQLVDEALEPLLGRGTWVLLDRFVDSSLAYQGAGRELGHRCGSRDQRVRDRWPDAGSDVAAEQSIRRSAASGRRAGRSAPDRLERNPTSSSSGSPTPTGTWQPPTRSGSGRSTRRSHPTRCSTAALGGARRPSLSTRRGRACMNAHASAIIRSSSGLWALPAELGADPLAGRRPASADRPGAAAPRASGSRRRSPCAAAAITSRTEKPLPLPRLKIWCSPDRAPSSASRCAAARSSMWM